MKFTTKKITTMGALAALGLVLMITITFPIIPAAPYLKYEPADVAILMASLIFGPFEGIIVTFIISIIEAGTIAASDHIVGFFMHFLASGTLALVVGLIYKRFPSIKGLIISLIFGSLSMTAMMVLANLVITPIYYHMAVGDVIKMLVPIIIPFNIIKSVGNSFLTFVIFASISKFIKRLNLNG